MRALLPAPVFRTAALQGLLLGLIGLALVRPGPSPAFAEEPPKKAPAEPGKDGGAGGGDEEEPDDFFDGETSFTPKQVDEAIKKGVMWLKKRQSRDGSWGEISGGQLYGGGQGKGYPHPAGCTALALYTLLKCKESPKDPVVQKGFKYLQDTNNALPGSSYETSVLLLAVCATADPNKTSKASDKAGEKLKLTGPMRKWAQDLVNHLLDKRQKRTWRYNFPNEGPPPGGMEDLSSTQLAALALFSANRLGIKVKEKIWEDILTYALDQQDETGPDYAWEDPVTKKKSTWKSRGFAYIRGQEDPSEGQATGGMTACGVTMVEMCRFILSDGGRKKAEWAKRPDAAKVQNAIQDGLAWFDLNWSPFDNPKKVSGNIYHLYYLYAFERMMDMLGQQRLGKHMWYSEMGQQILNRQNEDGHWKTGVTLDPGDVQDTCFALLFLKRATKGAIPFPSLTGGSDDAPPVDNR